MALFKYFKRTSKHTEGHRETLSANDINKANESIAKALEVKGWEKYNTLYRHLYIIKGLIANLIFRQLCFYLHSPNIMVTKYSAYMVYH